MKRLFRHHGLSLTLFVIFSGILAGQFAVGRLEHNEERAKEGERALSAAEYFRSPHFLEATMENWESEFLQMCMFVVLTVWLHQKGSAESNDPDHPPSLRGRAHPKNTHAPGPVRRGGWRLRLYEHSLSSALFVLFALSFAGHASGGAALYNEERARQQEPALTVWDYMGTSRFWFESLQNWQSEFLAIGAMVVLTIFLRERGSPESKRVEAPHWSNE